MSLPLWYKLLELECSVGQQADPSELLNTLSFSRETLNKEQFSTCIEKLSGGENTVVFDRFGVPSIMVRVPFLDLSSLTGGKTVQPFSSLVWNNGTPREIWVGKYLTSLWNGHGASLPYQQPVFLRSYGEAMSLCAEKGTGFSAMAFQVRAVLCLISYKLGTLPHGNNENGHDHFHPEEHGNSGEEGTVLTGSGPSSWSHNGKASGVWDLNGNLNEWDSGLRLINGEIQMLALDRIAVHPGPERVDSDAWYALDASGYPCRPGSPETLHYQGSEDKIILTDKLGPPALSNCDFRDIRCAVNSSAESELILAGLLPPRGRNHPFMGWRWVSTEGECLPLCGGAYKATYHAGAAFAGITHTRTDDYALGGVRLMYIPR